MKSVSHFIKSSLIKGTFLRNLLFTFSSNAAIYIINLIFYPIITRIYSPEAYTEYAIWTILFNNLMVVVSLGYQDALVITDSRRDYFKLGSAIVYLSIILSTLAGLLYLSLNSLFWEQFELKELWWMIFAFPIAIFASLQQILNLGTVRFGLIERSAKITAYIRITSKILVLAVGWFGVNNGFGLLVGDVFFVLVGIFIILPKKQTILFMRELLRLDLKDGLNLLKINFDYPKYVFPTIWVVILIQQVPLISIGSEFKVTDLGLYTFCWGLLGVPIGMMMKSIRPVFFHKNIQMRSISKEEKKQKIRQFMHTQFAILTLFLIGGFWATEWFYDFLFSSKWSEGKDLIQAIILGSGGVILGSPMASVFKVNGKIKTDFLIRIVSLGILVLLSVSLIANNVDLLEYAFWFNAFYFASYIVLFLFQLKEFDFEPKELILASVKISLVLGGFLIVTVPFQ